ncbi:alkaline phosphatase family protein [Natronomonas marina]|uniref:alkaline phosphatase family protein n=1 Tax=Natronomonas marina TaxID=2961939 RepID=UPI0020C98614|nr:alkaline phosphatase family protein [Natronomonas marina]
MTTVVLGLDGGSFELIQPWLDEGRLPNFSTLVTEGTAADMQSCLPPVTCPNWQCYATGTNPGKLGVFWWESVDRAAERIENRSRSDDFDGVYFWRLLEDEPAVINLPTSYPPSCTEGIHVAGGPGAEQTGYTYPDSLEAELEREYDYAVHPERMSLLSEEASDNECVDEIYELIDTRFDVLEDLLTDGEHEFVHVTVFYLNVLQHFYWDMDVVRRAWERIDERVGRLLSMEALEHLFVMSDHGANEIRTTVRINAWLAQNGYLQTRSSISDYLHAVGLTRERVRPVLARLEIEWLARRLLPERIQMYLPDEEGSVDKSAKESVVDWRRSQAVASGQGPLYVLADDPVERKRIAAELVSDLEGLTDLSGAPVFDQVLRGEEVYIGEYVERGPDIVLDQAPGVHIEGKIGVEDVFGSPETWRGENKDTGLFVGYGPDIDASATLDGMHILDIAPTLLHLHGNAVPERMDGTVRRGLFESGSAPAERAVSRTELADLERATAESTDSDVTDRLTDLGYME